jgi:hypothetical protein
MTAPPENPFAGRGAVLLDIGDDIGALVVTMPAGLAGVEVEIRPVAGPDLHHHHPHDQHHGHSHHPHVAVVDRPVENGRVPSLVFPELAEGRYELHVKETYDVHLTVDIRGGEVTNADWPR